MPENLVSRDGLSRPVSRQPAHFHTQAKFGAYLRDSSRVPWRCPTMYVCMYVCMLRRVSVARVNTRLQRYVGQLPNRTAALLIYLL